MIPQPQAKKSEYKGSEKLQDKIAIITGGDSGIGRAVAILYAKEGADVAILYNESDDDEKETQQYAMNEGRKCLLIKGDVGNESLCVQAVDQVACKIL